MSSEADVIPFDHHVVRFSLGWGWTQQPSCLQPQIQVLRYQSVGSRCSVAASGPRLTTVTLDQDVVGTRLGVFQR